MKTHQNKFLSRSALSITLLATLSAQAAPVLPDAGQTMRELQKQPEINLPKTPPVFLPEQEAAPQSAESDQVRIVVNKIQVTGSSVFTSQELEALVANLAGGEHSLAELNAGAARITAWYRERGYVVARAYIPAQDINDGVVVINVLEGLLGQQQLTNRSRLSDSLAKKYFKDIKTGEALQAKPVDRALLLMNDTPGIGSARATLQPGASVGSSDLLIELTPSTPYTANVELDNFGSYYTGVNRLGAALAFNSPLKLGDQLIVRALSSDMNMTYVRLAYQMPLGESGLRVGVAYADTGYKLGREYANLLSHGTATSSSVYAVYPFIRSQTSNLSGTVTWEDKKLNDRTDAINPKVITVKQVQLVNFGLTGNHQDTQGNGGSSSIDLSLVSGHLSMDGGSSDPVSLSSYSATQSDGAFLRFDYNFSRLQPMAESNVISLALSGQFTNKNLNSSEKFSLGGANGVRAYPQGEGSGDVGWMENIEFRHNFQDTLQGIVFYDVGSVIVTRNPYATGTNTRFISGVGLGINSYLGGIQIKANMAWRASGGLPTSEPAAHSSGPRIWLQAGKQF